VTLRTALKSFGLPSLDASSDDLAGSDGFKGFHAVPVWDDRIYDMVAAIPPRSGRSAWENRTCSQCGSQKAGENDAVCPKCAEPLPRPVVEDPDGTFRLVKGFRNSSYRRMRLGKPASTITTASGHVGSDNTIHPWENRLFSTLECALLQTFPKTFRWGDALKKWGHTNVRQMIGEAVPPAFTQQHGRALIGLLNNRWRVAPMAASDDRCTSAWRKLKKADKRLYEKKLPKLAPLEKRAGSVRAKKELRVRYASKRIGKGHPGQVFARRVLQ